MSCLACLVVKIPGGCDSTSPSGHHQPLLRPGACVTSGMVGSCDEDGATTTPPPKKRRRDDKKKSKRSKRRRTECSDDSSTASPRAARKEHRKKKKKKRESKRHQREKSDGGLITGREKKLPETEAETSDAKNGPAGVQSDRNPDEERLEARRRAMIPMTKEQYEANNARITEVFDEESGRYRLVRGNGEIVERIVSRQQHQQINRQATQSDGASFARHVHRRARY